MAQTDNPRQHLLPGPETAVAANMPLYGVDVAMGGAAAAFAAVS